jgi:hypothetical protein
MKKALSNEVWGENKTGRAGQALSAEEKKKLAASID